MAVAEQPRAHAAHGPPTGAPHRHTVECVAYEVSPGRYRAICLDLSLVAESRESMRDAQQRLVAQVVDYLTDAMAEGCPPHLLNRGFSRWERVGLRLRIAKRGLESLVSDVLSRPSSVGDRAVWHEPVAACR